MIGDDAIRALTYRSDHGQAPVTPQHPGVAGGVLERAKDGLRPFVNQTVRFDELRGRRESVRGYVRIPAGNLLKGRVVDPILRLHTPTVDPRATEAAIPIIDEQRFSLIFHA